MKHAQEGDEVAADIVIAMRNEMSAELDKAFGELAFLWPLAQDLNLRDAEDRAIFRGRVSERLKLTRVEAMRDWVGGTMRDRHAATRAVADAYIAKADTFCRQSQPRRNTPRG